MRLSYSSLLFSALVCISSASKLRANEHDSRQLSSKTDGDGSKSNKSAKKSGHVTYEEVYDYEMKKTGSISSKASKKGGESETTSESSSGKGNNKGGDHDSKKTGASSGSKKSGKSHSSKGSKKEKDDQDSYDNGSEDGDEYEYDTKMTSSRGGKKGGESSDYNTKKSNSSSSKGVKKGGDDSDHGPKKSGSSASYGNKKGRSKESESKKIGFLSKRGKKGGYVEYDEVVDYGMIETGSSDEYDTKAGSNGKGSKENKSSKGAKKGSDCYSSKKSESSGKGNKKGLGKGGKKGSIDKDRDYYTKRTGEFGKGNKKGSTDSRSSGKDGKKTGSYSSKQSKKGGYDDCEEPAMRHPTVPENSAPASMPTRPDNSAPANSAAAPVAKPTHAPYSSPVAKPTVLPTSSPVAKSSNAPYSSPVAKSTVLPTSSPVAKSSNAPYSSPVAKPTVLPTSSPVAKSSNAPYSSPVAKATVLPSSSPVAKSSSAPMAKATTGPASSTVAEPTNAPYSSPVPNPTKSPEAAEPGVPGPEPADPAAVSSGSDAPQTTEPEPGASAPSTAPGATNPDGNNILEAASEVEKLSTLVSLLEAPAQADLLFALLGGGPFTLFAPSNAAFAKFAETKNMSTLDAQAVTFILAYHVYSDEVRSSDIETGFITALNGDGIYVEARDDGVTLNKNVNVVQTDILGWNGVIHIIDQVLMPPLRDITGIANDNGLNMLLQALETTALLETLQGEGPFTLFAPTDAAFAKLGNATIDALFADIPTLTNILLYHVTNGFIGSGMLEGMETIETLAEEARITIRRNGLVLNGNTRLTLRDILATNGVVHEIDTVLIPPVMDDPQ